MTPDDDREYDPSDDPDAVIRDLELKIVGLQAQLDQYTASLRDQAVVMERLEAEQAELHRLIQELEASRQRFLRRIRRLALVYAALGSVIVQFLWAVVVG